MLQCTWREKPNQPPRLFPGSLLGGYRGHAAQTRTWKNVLQRARFRLVDGELLLSITYIQNHRLYGISGWKMKKSLSTIEALQLYGQVMSKIPWEKAPYRRDHGY